jgi:uncharacterized membrane protein YedE/YeeE
VFGVHHWLPSLSVRQVVVVVQVVVGVGAGLSSLLLAGLATGAFRLRRLLSGKSSPRPVGRRGVAGLAAAR